MLRNTVWTMLWLCTSLTAFGQTFDGFDSSNLPQVTDAPGDWGLKIVVFDVGQADAVLILPPNGDVCLVDSGKTNSAGNEIADYLASQTLNSVGILKTVDLLYTTHYDEHHIGGLPKLVQRGIGIRKAFDQGISSKRSIHFRVWQSIGLWQVRVRTGR